MSQKFENKITFKEKFQYAFENTIAEGPKSVIKWLAILSIFSVTVLGLIILLFGISDSPDTTEGLGFFEGTWKSLMATLDPGTMGGDAGWPFRIVRFVATLVGIFLISILIGTISSGIDEKMEELKRGKSKVIEKNHTLILGWSDKIFSIINELIIANENQKKPCIVILSEKDKVEAEEEIKSKVPNFKNTKIVVRSGSPLDTTDVSISNPNEAKSILVLSPDGENADIYVIKTVLGLTKNRHRKEGTLNIVAEIKEEKNLEAAELVGNEETIFIQSADIISRITAQTCLQSGLSVVYSEILQFDGDEIYFKEETDLVGKTYKESLFKYNDSSVFGIFTSNEETLINPSMDYVIQKGDKIIAISEDDDTIVMNAKKDADLNPKNIGIASDNLQEPKATLVLGWNSRGSKIIKELNEYVAKDSTILIIADLSSEDDLEIDALDKETSNLEITHQTGEISDRKTLGVLFEKNFDNIIVLSYAHLSVQESDAKTLICLLHLRNISEQQDKNFNIVTEMLDLNNRELGVVAKADDFIVGDNLISLLLTQISENGELKKVYDELFKSEGSEIYLKPASRFVTLNTDIDFYNIIANASALNDTAIGYRISSKSEDMEENFGIKLNPKKDQKVSFSEEEFIIVLSED